MVKQVMENDDSYWDNFWRAYIWHDFKSIQQKKNFFMRVNWGGRKIAPPKIFFKFFFDLFVKTCFKFSQ